MNNLSETWFVEGNIDFELKKYTLLAYLKQVNACFGKYKLYPELADLVFHFNNLNTFKKNKHLLQHLFPKKLKGVELEKLRLLYEEMIADGELMAEIESIVLYALDTLKPTISCGTDLYDFVENNISITPVGIIPLEINEGYFFLADGSSRSVRVYQYRLSIFEQADAKYRSLRSEYIDSRERSFSNTYEHIKADLIRENRQLPAPAVYSIETNLTYPVEETLLPVAKRSLVRYISSS